MTAGFRSKILDFAEELRIARVIANPVDYFAVQIAGATRVIQFDGDFSLRCGPREKQLLHSLAALAYNGARFTARTPAPPDLWALPPGEGTILTPDGIRFALDSINPTIFGETFIYDVHYCGDELTGRLVVDVGANVGDSSLYFAQRGAEVYAYEPDPGNFALLLRNIGLNPELQSRIHPINHAIGRDGSVSFHSGLGGASGMYEHGGRVLEVPSESLATVVATLGSTRPWLLKCDCKGCEFDLCQQPAMRTFEKVAIEYNADLQIGTLGSLTGALRERGFTKFRVFKHNPAPFRLANSGILEAS